MKLVVGQVVEESSSINYVQESHSSVKGGKRQTAAAAAAFSSYFDSRGGREALVTPLGSFFFDLRNFPKRFLGWQWTAKKFLYYSDVSNAAAVEVATK